jgi:hypothetical protein
MTDHRQGKDINTIHRDQCRIKNDMEVSCSSIQPGHRNQTVKDLPGKEVYKHVLNYFVPGVGGEVLPVHEQQDGQEGLQEAGEQVDGVTDHRQGKDINTIPRDQCRIKNDTEVSTSSIQPGHTDQTVKDLPGKDVYNHVLNYFVPGGGGHAGGEVQVHEQQDGQEGLQGDGGGDALAGGQEQDQDCQEGCVHCVWPVTEGCAGGHVEHTEEGVHGLQGGLCQQQCMGGNGVGQGGRVQAVNSGHVQGAVKAIEHHGRVQGHDQEGGEGVQPVQERGDVQGGGHGGVKPRFVQARRRRGIKPDGLIQTRIQSLFSSIQNSEGGGQQITRNISGLKVNLKRKLSTQVGNPEAKCGRLGMGSTGPAD